MDIREAQKINLLLLKEFDRFCKKHDIKYRLEAGTLLGAIRHKGFIPWDDDCDVALTRCEYNKLKEALRIDNFDKSFKYESVGDNIDKDHFYDFVDRLFYIDKPYRKEEKYKKCFGGMYQYLWLDIFILDELIESTKQKNYLRLKILYGEAMGHRYHINYNDYNTPIQKAEVLFLSTIGKGKKLEDIYKAYSIQPILNTNNKKDNETITKYYYSNYPIKWMGWEVDKSLEDEYIYVDFEDTKLPVNKDYDKMLKNLYDDYMTLPSDEEKIPNHVDLF